MARYIDADKADVEAVHTSHIGYSSKADIVEWLEKQPTADVVEVKHGHWIDDIKVVSTVGMPDIKAPVGYKCSECGRTEVCKEPYCNCGAKMDEGANVCKS